MAAGNFRWGILGTGNIARQFARDLAALPGHQLAAVASRSRDAAEAFCQGYGGTAITGYEALLRREHLDAVYLSLPNHLHAEWTIRCLEAGHHVLCEKPLALSPSEARAMFGAAHQTGRVLTEAFMYRAHPQTAALLAAVRSGEIGRLTHIRTSFCFHLRNTAGNIRMDPAMGGGALLDVGCYCIDFSALIASSPVSDVRAVCRLHDSGVDMMTSGLLAFENGVQATFTCGMDAQTDNSAVISGTEGYLTVAWPWKPSPETAGFTIARGIPPKQDLKPGQKPITPPPRLVQVPADLPLYALQVRAFAAACRGEAPPFITEAESLHNAATLKRVRRAAALQG